MKVVVDGEQIILTPRRVADELEEFILSDMSRDGKLVNGDTIREYKVVINKTLDRLVAEEAEEYGNKQYVSLSDLKRENNDV